MNEKMPKQTLFDEDSEEEVQLKTENEYAKKYDQWRGKEEIHKLEQKYGSKVLNSDASISLDSEDESDEPPEVSEEMETQFLKTLALLKNKDPRIYDPGYKFFDEKEKKQVQETKVKSLTFADSDDEDDDDDNIFSIEKKAEIDEPITDVKETKTNGNQTKKDGKIKEYLTGRVDHIDDTVQRDLEPLKALWSDPTINEGEAFLRDYILNKKYLEEGSLGAAEDRLRDDDDLKADEETVELQDKFERAYNFRFEEPDQEYLKRFPRTMNSIRPKDDRRAKSRAEVRTRKDDEKTRKMEEIGRLKALKLQEIHEKIARLKEVTGNQDLGFKDEDIEGDFDPAAHDRRMRDIFDEQYYGVADDQKPVFPDLDKELEIENWDEYDPAQASKEAPDFTVDGHCEDDDFNMDADYEAGAARATLLEEMRRSLGTKRRNRKNKSKLARLLAQDKPTYIPTAEEKTYDQHMLEYYNMDCEDVIGGDLPTRFKYREVVPNDYGLTIEEILLADDKELTQWVPLKKIVRHRPESVQKSEVNSFAQKAADHRLKRKVLPSLYKNLPEEPELVVSVEDNNKKRKKNMKKKQKEATTDNKLNDNAEENESNVNDNTEQNSEAEAVSDSKAGKKKRKRKKDKVSKNLESTENSSLDVDNEVKSNVVGSEKKNKAKERTISNGSDVNTNFNDSNNKKSKNKKERTVSNSSDVNKVNISNDTNNTTVNTSTEGSQSLTKRQKKNLKKKLKKLEKLKNATPSKDGRIGNKKRKLSLSETQVPIKKQKIEFNVKKDKSNKEGRLHKEKTKPEKEKPIPDKEGNETKTFSKEANRPGKEINKNKSLSKEQRKPDKEGQTNNSFNKRNKLGTEEKKNKDTKNKDKFKNKNKNNDQFKNKIKQIIDKTKNIDKSDNPMNSLSDERLKAYGLNPKKYRGFLKYKKF